LEEIIEAPVKKTETNDRGIRCADHATPSIRKTWHYFANKRRSLGRHSSLAGQSNRVFLIQTSCKKVLFLILPYLVLSLSIYKTSMSIYLIFASIFSLCKRPRFGVVFAAQVSRRVSRDKARVTSCKIQFITVRLEVLTAVLMKTSVFWVQRSITEYKTLSVLLINLILNLELDGIVSFMLRPLHSPTPSS
jgi:hypothetical protein